MDFSTWADRSPLTRKQMADFLGVHRTTLHGYLVGKLMPRPDHINAICTLTEGAVNADDLAKAYNR